MGIVFPHGAPAGLRWFCLGVIILLIPFFCHYSRMAISREAADFEYFYKASRWLLNHGGMDGAYDLTPTGGVIPRGSIEWYLPFTSRVFTLISWMPHDIAGYAWMLTNATCLVALLIILGRNFTELPARDWPVNTILPLIFTAVFWHWEFRLNQTDLFTLLLLTSAFVCWQRGQSNISGFWLGIAILLKLTPGLIAIWFLLKRQYRVVSVAALTALAFGPLADLIVFRFDHVGDVYRAWFQQAIVRGSHTGLILDQREIDWRNQSLSAVASRWLHPTTYDIHFDNDPRIRVDTRDLKINIADLSRPTIVKIVLSVAAISALGLFWLGRRPASKMTQWELRLEWALFILAMLWLMPVMRRYHLIWAFPTIVILGAALNHVGLRSWWSKWALATTILVMAAQLIIGFQEFIDSNLLEAGGIFLATVFLLALPAIFMLMYLRRLPMEQRERLFATRRRVIAAVQPRGFPAATQPTST